uniref:Uncharacterized protein n=1 Tax=Arundo donax TaxID=35708 RepID=A0A0A9CEN5_ARUDO
MMRGLPGFSCQAVCGMSRRHAQISATPPPSAASVDQVAT